MKLQTFSRLIYLDLKRALLSHRFILAALGIFFFLFSMGRVIEMTVSDICFLIDLSIAGSSITCIIHCLLPMLPYAHSYITDHNANSIRYQCSRCGLTAYITSKFLTVFLSGMLAYILASAAFVLAYLPRMPLYTSNNALNGYASLLDAGRPVAYLACFIFHNSMTAGMFACLSLCASSLTANTFTAMSLPIVLDFVYLRLCNLLPIPEWLHERYVMQGPGDMGSAPLTMLTKAGIVCVVLLFCYAITYIAAKRRYSNA